MKRSLLCLLLILLGLSLAPTPALADTTLSAEIVSWQVLGLDSNSWDTDGPDTFLVQATVTNTGGETAAGVEATIALAPSLACGGPCVTLVSGGTYSIGSIAAGATADAFWTVRVARTDAAFSAYESGVAVNTTGVGVTVTANNVVGSVTATQGPHTVPPLCGQQATSIPSGQLFVERLVSQARNDVLSYSLSAGTEVSPGVWEVPLGTAFTVTVNAETSTEFAEISVPAIVAPTDTIIPTEATFTFSLGTPADDDVYTLDAGGQIVASYDYNAAALGEVQLAQLIYDCSGGAYHYNADYGEDAITIRVVAPAPPPPPPPAISLSKSATPNPAAPGQRITVTISYRNEGGPATGVVITDVIDPLLTEVVPDARGAYEPTTRTITWPLGDLAAGSTGSVSFTAEVSEVAAGRTIANVAVGTAAGVPAFSSPPIQIRVTPAPGGLGDLSPETGVPSVVLAILGFASIGFGSSLASRALERTRI